MDDNDKCYMCDGPFALGWWCTKCKHDRSRSDSARRCDQYGTSPSYWGMLAFFGLFVFFMVLGICCR